jgi:Pyruvate/2-oxoacid:ferredoxin oxidoreductase delta subunit
LLVAILVAALLGNLTLLIFDPITIFTRTMTTAVIPALTYAFNGVESILYRVPFLNPGLDWIESLLRGSVLPVWQPVFAQNILIATLFFIILGLNFLAPRFWCRYLCPLGALFGLLSKVSLFRPVIGSACNQCTRCVMVCDPGAINADKGGFSIMPSECTVCLDCLVDCKKADIQFKLVINPAPAHEHDLTRREALGAMGAGAIGVLLLSTDLRARIPYPYLIQPPGVEVEDVFLSTCIRCSQCMKICPTTALQPALTESGLEGLWTPVLIPRAGYCDYGCNACGQVCPSGAIPDLGLDVKRQMVIGKASVNRDCCLPWSFDTPCIVCEEMCPTPQKSIFLEEVVVDNDEGEITLQRPTVIRNLCIGCGICEYQCPLEGEAAIRVYSASPSSGGL